MQTVLSPFDVEARIPVWGALSDLWLDTELQPYEREHIARIIAVSPYTLAEIREIRDYELMPVLGANLLSVAGEWVGFNAQWLTRQCSEAAGRRASVRFRMGCRMRSFFLEHLIREDWQQVMRFVCGMRGIPQDA